MLYEVITRFRTSPGPCPAWLPITSTAIGVITSYSIHYTKLYDGSARASRYSPGSMAPRASSRPSNRSLFSPSRSRFAPGCTRAGWFGSTAKVAASAQVNESGERLKYRQEAASSPTTFPPKGAFPAYSSRISRLVSYNFV